MKESYLKDRLNLKMKLFLDLIIYVNIIDLMYYNQIFFWVYCLVYSPTFEPVFFNIFKVRTFWETLSNESI
jgi:hypothetical protein